MTTNTERTYELTVCYKVVDGKPYNYLDKTISDVLGNTYYDAGAGYGQRDMQFMKIASMQVAHEMMGKLLALGLPLCHLSVHEELTKEEMAEIEASV